ncbi:GNAT family N-acetyltransferase [Gulbenkiania mobilis]|uniref:Acetyltransferase (GNAT) family protein n=1 Tax=Gulbenkiania mobilis TaxID=397457 RepID=A0ABY2CZI4_GULMO|nr:GNAT family N-acetyltransferase [Gulbenkiania mobilis]TCW33092.1 acetyltransferase (GNAT) family protein [Gulbenkiania mobilis]
MTALPASANLGLVVRRLDPASESDRAHLVALTDAYARDPMGGGDGLSEHARAHLAEAFAAHPATFALLAERNGEPVGLALCVLGFSSFYAAPTVNLHDISVTPQARGTGVGRALLAAVEAEGSARGCAKVTLEVRPDNRVGRQLYESQGFELSALGGAAYLMMEKKLV